MDHRKDVGSWVQLQLKISRGVGGHGPVRASDNLQPGLGDTVTIAIHHGAGDSWQLYHAPFQLYRTYITTYPNLTPGRHGVARQIAGRGVPNR